MANCNSTYNETLGLFHKVYIYICIKDFVEEFLKTENENKLKQMMDICHNACQYITGY